VRVQPLINGDEVKLRYREVAHVCVDKIGDLGLHQGEELVDLERIDYRPEEREGKAPECQSKEGLP